LAAIENSALHSHPKSLLRALPLVLCLGAAFFLAPPRGSSAAGAGPSWVGGTRAMPSGEIWGENGPTAGALIGLTQPTTSGTPIACTATGPYRATMLSALTSGWVGVDRWRALAPRTRAPPLPGYPGPGTAALRLHCTHGHENTGMIGGDGQHEDVQGRFPICSKFQGGGMGGRGGGNGLLLRLRGRRLRAPHSTQRQPVFPWFYLVIRVSCLLFKPWLLASSSWLLAPRT
jgi:hypothetical protein